ncbi:MAG: 3-keto-disaccharide hydrolase, partial [Verrucomicrobiia bacterium]
PKVNAARPPMEWQTYDINFTPAVYEGGKLKESPRITVRLNGIVVQKNEELRHQTAHVQADRVKPAPDGPRPISLQDHSNRIQFRNTWVKEL